MKGESINAVQYMNTKEAARLLNISTRQLARYVALDAIPYVALKLPGRVRRQLRFNRDQLEAWLQPKTA